MWSAFRRYWLRWDTDCLLPWHPRKWQWSIFFVLFLQSSAKVVNAIHPKRSALPSMLLLANWELAIVKSDAIFCTRSSFSCLYFFVCSLVSSIPEILYCRKCGFFFFFFLLGQVWAGNLRSVIKPLLLLLARLFISILMTLSKVGSCLSMRHQVFLLYMV